MKALLQPLPLGRIRNTELNNTVLQVEEHSYVIDPEKTLQSVMRALFVLKQVRGGQGGAARGHGLEEWQPSLQERALQTCSYVCSSAA